MNKIRKVLCVFPHGLGDHVMLTPGLRKYKSLNPDTYISLASLGRFGDTVKQLLSGLPYIDEFLPILPDPWNDFENYSVGMKYIEQLVISEYSAKFDEVKFIPTNRLQGFKLHKVFRIADELGIEFDSIEELATELAISKKALSKAKKILSKYNKKILILHNKAGNPPKEFSKEILEQLCADVFSDFDILEFGCKSTSRSHELSEKDMELTKALVYKADAICAIDSVIMHIAGAFRKNLLALFKSTLVHQAIPFFGNIQLAGDNNNLTEIRNWPKYRDDIVKYFNRNQIKKVDSGDNAGKVLITGTGHSGGNWVTEIVNLSNVFQFTKIVEDRNLFSRKSLPERYGTKLATDNIGVTSENLKNLLEQYQDLKIIFTLRHPVDTCLSKIYRATPSDENESVLIEDTLNYSWDGSYIGSIKSIEYMYSILSFLKKEYSDRLLIVRLEDLITNSREEVDRICNFLSIEKNSRMLEAYKYSRNRHHAKRYNGKLDKSQINIREKWKEIYGGFFKDKQDIVNRLSKDLKDLVDKLGYSDESFKHQTKEEKVVSTPHVIENTSTSLLELPDIYHHPMVYWAHMITFRCNGNCPYCIVDGRGKHKDRSELSGKEILNWWNGIHHKDKQRLSLIGGETTLHKDIVEIVNNLDSYAMTITTNCVDSDFWNNERFKEFKIQDGASLRINTSFHPHAISPEKYIERINRMRDCGLYVDQVAFVYTPEVETKWKKQIEQVRESLPELKSPPFLGFWTKENGYAKDFSPEFLYPNESYWDQDSARNMCGIHDYDFYRVMCGQSEFKTVMCPHGIFSLIIAPDGNYYNCHYRLYYDIDPICNIKNFRAINLEDLKCHFYGACNWCDLPRLEFGINNVKVDDVKWLEKVPTFDINKYLAIQEEVESDGIRFSVEDCGERAKIALNICLKHLPDKEDLPSEFPLILDIGCNTGYNTKLLAERYGDAIGIDINKKLIEASSRNWKKCYLMDMHNISFGDEYFDLVFAKSVLEHSYNPVAVLSNIYRVLKFDGYLIALLPMDGNDKSFIDYSMQYGNKSHLWKTNFEACVSTIEQCGFIDIQLYKYKYSENFGFTRHLGDNLAVIVAKKS